MNGRWLLVLMTIGCAGTPAETVPTPPTVPPPAVEAPAPPAPPPAAEEAPAPSTGGLTVVVDTSKQIGEGPAAGGAPVTVVATPKTNRIDVAIDQIVSYCKPDPSFTAVAKPEALELTLVRPADGVSRCFGTHHVEAHVDLPGRNNLRKVVVLDADGKTLAEAPIASAP